MRSPCMFILATLMLAGTSPAETFNVNPGESIQPVLDKTSDGDIVVLAAGSYAESLVFPDRLITLRGAIDKDGAPASHLVGDSSRAIEVSSNLNFAVIENLSITGTDTTGGGLLLQQSNTIVNNCIFENCVATTVSPLEGGGAVYVVSTYPTHAPSFSDCLFQSNTAATDGGAIGLHTPNSQFHIKVHFTDCVFDSNTAAHGGAISCTYHNNAGAVLERCSLINNSAAIDGTAIYNSSASVTSMHSCNICGTGSLIYGYYEDLGHNCLTDDCTDGDGDLRPDDCDQCPGSEPDDDDNGWSDCAQEDNGDGTTTFKVAAGTQVQPALDFAQDGDIVELAAGSYAESLVFPDRAITLRGAVDEDGAPASILEGASGRAIEVTGNLDFAVIENLSITGTDTTGGGLLLNGSNTIVNNCLFENCVATTISPLEGGGAVYVISTYPTHAPSFSDCLFKSNTAVSDGGAVGLYTPNSQFNIKVHFTDCVFDSNSADHGGAISCTYHNNAGAVLERCSLINNSAAIDGTAIYNSSSSVTSMHSCNICGSGSLIFGYYEDLGHNCLTDDCTDGDGDLRPDDCDQCPGSEPDDDENGWSDCAQVDNGGGSFTFKVAAGTQIQPALDFAQDGWIVELAAGSYVESLVFPDRAITLRGAVDEDGFPASFLDGDSSRAIEVTGNLDFAVIENLSITGTDTTGGGLLLNGSNTIVNNCIFENCVATTDYVLNGGGAVFVVSTYPTHAPSFSNCLFQSNTAVTDGGAVGLFTPNPQFYINVQFTDCMFLSNSAASGGAIASTYFNNSGAELVRCLFMNNTGEGNGTAIYNASSDVTSMYNCILCGPVSLIYGYYEDLGGNCLTNDCTDADGDFIPDDCDDDVTPCEGDADESGAVDVLDLLQVISLWGPCPGCPEDIDGNGVVDVFDLLAVISAWGPCS